MSRVGNNNQSSYIVAAAAEGSGSADSLFKLMEDIKSKSARELPHMLFQWRAQQGGKINLAKGFELLERLKDWTNSEDFKYHDGKKVLDAQSRVIGLMLSDNPDEHGKIQANLLSVVAQEAVPGMSEVSSPASKAALSPAPRPPISQSRSARSQSDPKTETYPVDDLFDDLTERFDKRGTRIEVNEFRTIL